MKNYYVKYSYINYYGAFDISDEHYCETLQEAKDFIKSLKERRKLTSLTLITYEKLI